MKKYKYITISESLSGGYIIKNNKSQEWIGSIVYYHPWKRFVFTTKSSAIVWTTDCQHDVIDFMENEIPKAGRKERG